MGNIAVEPLSRAKIRGRAAFLRNVLGLQGLYIRIDIVLEIMACPMKNADPLIEMEICEDYEMPNEYAVYSPQKKSAKSTKQRLRRCLCRKSARQIYFGARTGAFFPSSLSNLPVCTVGGGYPGLPKSRMAGKYVCVRIPYAT